MSDDATVVYQMKARVPSRETGSFSGSCIDGINTDRDIGTIDWGIAPQVGDIAVLKLRDADTGKMFVWAKWLFADAKGRRWLVGKTDAGVPVRVPLDTLPVVKIGTMIASHRFASAVTKSSDGSEMPDAFLTHISRAAEPLPAGWTYGKSAAAS